MTSMTDATTSFVPHLDVAPPGGTDTGMNLPAMTATATAADADAVAAAIRLLADHGDHRVLRRINESTLPILPDVDDALTRIGLVIDVETAGLDEARDPIIELAARRFRFNAAGQIVGVGITRLWREDPGRPLDPVITRLTGLTDADLVGQRIDTAAATALIRSAHVVIAHNALFDCGRIEARLQDAAGRPWACSMREVDWPALRFDGRGLGWLLAQAGWFYPQHRAETDVLALLHLLAHEHDGKTVLSHLLERAEQPTIKLEVFDTPMAARPALKMRGYAWDPGRRYWWREVAPGDADDEQAWLHENRCQRPAHRIEQTWRDRHR